MAEKNVSYHNCQSCKRRDSADYEMVQCDICQLWEHFGCAGVGDEIRSPHAKYTCERCSHKEKPNEEHLNVPAIETRSSKSSKLGAKTHSRVGSRRGKRNDDLAESETSSTRAVLLSEQLKLVEEQSKLEEQALLEEGEIKRRLLEEEERQLEESKRLRERKLKEELELRRSQQRVRKESLEKRQVILRQLAESSSARGSVVNSNEMVKNWLDEQTSGRSEGNRVEVTNNHRVSQIPEDPVGQPSSLQVTLPQNPLVEPILRDILPREQHHSEPNPIPLGVPVSLLESMQNLGHHPTSPCSITAPRIPDETVPVSGHCPPMLANMTQDGPRVNTFSSPTLSQAQIAARQVLGKDLSIFSGNAEEWPIFISNFEQSTTTCGYSNAENLVRLQRCLKGNALESVRSRLLLPASVPHVIQTLRTIFGRPELLIRSLLNKIHQTPPPRHDRLETIMHFGLAVQNLVDHLKAAQQVNHLANPILLQELVEKLPGSMRLDWAIYKNRHQLVTLDTFGEFMSGLVAAVSEVSFNIPVSNVVKMGMHAEARNNKQKCGNTGVVQTHSADEITTPTPSTSKACKQCLSCGRVGHRVAECEQFVGACVDERWKLVQLKKLCRTCLNSHGKWPCRSWNGCGASGCRQKHHTLLHSNMPLERTNVSSSHVTSGELQWPLFRVLPVILHSNNASVALYAFIDEGSSYTLLDESIAKTLGASGKSESLTLKWTGNVTRVEPKSQSVQLDISGTYNKSRYTLLNTRTVSRLILPTQSLKYKNLANRFPHLRGLPLEDYESIEPKLLIGLDNLTLCVPLKLREGAPSHPIGAKCRLGWSIYGYIPTQSNPTAVIGFHVGSVSDSDRELNNQLQDYFTLEDAGVAERRNQFESPDEQRAIQLLQQTTRRRSTSSHFETGLLWRTDNPNFPDSYPMAVRRLQFLERRLQREPQLQELVRKLISEYETKGYAHRASLAELTSVEASRVWYLPLGVVTNPKKPGKIRLIWDAAAKVGDTSFNSQILKGPDLLASLPMVLHQFRQFPVAVSGDVMEMFHQLKIRSPDCQSQRFLFRDDPTELPQVYIMDVATFGSSCSPASAQFIKNLNAEEFADKYPRGAAAIKNKHYVDDYLDSFRTIEEAIAVVNEVKLIHSKGGFTLRRFLSNESEVLQGIGEATEGEIKNLLLERGGNFESVLGMNWIPNEDVFVFAFGLRDDI